MENIQQILNKLKSYNSIVNKCGSDYKKALEHKRRLCKQVTTINKQILEQNKILKSLEEQIGKLSDQFSCRVESELEDRCHRCDRRETTCTCC